MGDKEYLAAPIAHAIWREREKLYDEIATEGDAGDFIEGEVLSIDEEPLTLDSSADQVKYKR